MVFEFTIRLNRGAEQRHDVIEKIRKTVGKLDESISFLKKLKTRVNGARENERGFTYVAAVSCVLGGVFTPLGKTRILTPS